MIRGLIKIHNADSPIRRIVNWKNAPAYRLAKMLSKKNWNIHSPPIHLQCKKHNPFNEGLT